MELDKRLGDYTLDELKHWGIKGMKWGVRRYQNKDGTLTDKGKKRYADAWEKGRLDHDENPTDTFRKAGLDGTVISNIPNSLNKQKEAIQECYKEANSIMRGYRNSEADRTECDTISAVANVLKGVSEGVAYTSTKMNDVATQIFGHVLDDYDQGTLNGRTVYLKMYDKYDRAVKLSKKFKDANDNYTNDCKKIVDNILGEYGNKQLNKNFPKMTLGNTLVNRIKTHHVKDSDTESIGMYLINDGTDIGSKDRKTDEYINKATRLVSKMNINRKNAWNMSEAVSNLGYDNVDITEMSDHQWKTLNDEMERLRR